MTAVVVLAVAAAMAFLVLEQRAANDRILSALNDVNTALATQTTRSRGLEQQVAVLSERVMALEKEVIDLRRRVVQLSRRRVEVASAAPLAPVVPSAPFAPFAPYAPYAPGAPAESVAIVETLPITWSTDYRSFQPAGIIAPPAPIVLERKLTDPSFVKTLYVSYAALQASDIITTTAGLSRNARESNPLLRNVAHSPAAMIGVKAAGTVATIYTIERLRRRNPLVASITLIALNATMAAVTINNVTVASRQRREKP
jgi:hypothetical protein